MDDLDSPWKEFLDEFLPEFLALCFTDIYRRIDWSRPYESLDKELQQIAPECDEGRRYVDKLYRVYTLEGQPEWVLIHLEVQNQSSNDFAARMYVYNYRLFDRYQRRAVSLAILGDDDRNWRPDRYVDALWGCRVELQFPTVKLLDFMDRIDELEQSSNLAALVIAAHLKTVATRGNSEQRLTYKTQLVRNLFERGLSADEVRRLFKFIDWLMKLPRDLTIKFRTEVDALQQEKAVPYVSSFEQLAREEGIEIGLEKGRLEMLRDTILDNFQSRFGIVAPPEVAIQIRRISDLNVLKRLSNELVKRNQIEDAITLLENVQL